MCIRDSFRGDIKFRFPNYGFAVRQTLMADVRGDGNPELLVASETGYAYILGPEGEVLAQRDFGSIVADLAIVSVPDADTPRIAVACADGSVYLMDGEANLLAGLHLDNGAGLLGVLDVGDRTSLLAATGTALTCCTP